MDLLRETDAKVKWLSLEPLLSALPNMNLSGINWVVVGGESGRNARPMLKEWVIDIRNQCLDGNIPFFYKQGAGFKKADRNNLLDGKVYHEYPNTLLTNNNLQK